MSLTDPSLALQGAIISTLKNDQVVSGFVVGRVFDSVPTPSPSFPYISLGDAQVLPELAEFTNAADLFITLHIWSRAVGFPECKRIGAAVTAALHDATLTLADGTLQSLLLDSSRYLRDPDGLTSHGILTFAALTDAN